LARSKLPYLKIAGAAVVLGAGAYVLTRDSSSSSCSEEAFRKRVVDAARSQVGKADLDLYFADAAPQYVHQHPEWCGIFALWCLHQAGLAKNKIWKTGLGFLEVPPALPKTHDPQPGDIAYYSKFQHQAVVLKNNGDGTTENANGNGSGGVVTIGRPKMADAVAFYSIAGLIAEAQKDCK
jgi:hypothetical protein